MYTVVCITPNGHAKFSVDQVRRSFVAKVLFNDWRKKTPGEYIDIITRKYTKEERDKFPIVVDMRNKISELIARETELFIDGVQKDVEFLINKYWNQLKHHEK